MDENSILTIKVRVTPNAKSYSLKKDINADGLEIYRIYVTDTPEGGKANKSVIALLAKEFKVPKSNITIKHGFKSKDKLVEIILPSK